MSDEKLYTEREVREREREAFARGAEWYDGKFYRMEEDEATVEARHRYPITRKVPRERVRVQDWVSASVTCRDEDDVNLIRLEIEDSPSRVWLSRDGVRALVDLMDNPFEEVTE